VPFMIGIGKARDLRGGGLPAVAEIDYEIA
jgi:hypothetical protein